MWIGLGSALVAFLLGISARRGKDMDIQQFAVGNRGFGDLFFLLVCVRSGIITTPFQGLFSSSSLLWDNRDRGPVSQTSGRGKPLRSASIYSMEEII